MQWLLIIVFSSFLLADEQFDKILAKLYRNYDKTTNKISIAGVIGTSNYSNYGLSSVATDLIPVRIEYGFSRFNDKIFYNNYDYFSNEFAFYEHSNINALTDFENGFRPIKFGFAWGDGYSYKFNMFRLTLIHERALTWTKIRAGNIYPEIADFEFNWRFGGDFRSGLGVSISENIFLDFLYSESNIYPRFDFRWLIAFTGESILHRAPFFFQSKIHRSLGNFTPIIYWIYKSALTLILFDLQNEDYVWPIHSAQSIGANGINLRFRFTFNN